MSERNNVEADPVACSYLFDYAAMNFAEIQGY
jgi:hypothetical protein